MMGERLSWWKHEWKREWKHDCLFGMHAVPMAFLPFWTSDDIGISTGMEYGDRPLPILTPTGPG